MNCLKCGRPLEHSGHECNWRIETPSYYNNDKELYRLVQKLSLYNDMVEILKYLKNVLEKEGYPDDARFVQLLLDRAEKIKC